MSGVIHCNPLLKQTNMTIKEKAADKGITHEKLAEKLEISRNTLNARFIDGKWKNSQLTILKRLGLCEASK